MIARTLVVDVDGTIIATHCESKSQVDYCHRQRTIYWNGWVGSHNNEDIQAALGFGENVDALIDGSVVGGFTTLSAGDQIVVRAKANAKA
jgi:predicted secreted acid phosphatase